MKRLVLVLIVAAVIVLAFVFLKPTTPPAPTSNVTISNFAFSESSIKTAFCKILVTDKVIFQGPIAKPTPCNGLTANYTIEGSTIKIYITTTPYEGFCAQVIADTYYSGSFDLLQSATVQIYYAGEKICEKTVSITDTDKEQSCINSGGQVKMGRCGYNFPNLCALGNCDVCIPDINAPGCKDVKICDCGEGRCFDGNSCTTSTH